MHRQLARAISAVESGVSIERELDAFANAVPAGGAASAYVIGITGPPGAGKSTVVDHLIARFRERGGTVAVIAVDPSSAFTGGAVLGDRIRMQRHAADAGVFIRSMASRASGGGLAPATAHAIALCERAGFDVVIVETVGVGQVEIEIVSVADVVVVVTVPGLGDEVQSMKAGLTEIADVFVVNMADRPGANQTAADLVQMLRESERDVPVLKTTALDGGGVDELMDRLVDARKQRASNPSRTVRFAVLRAVKERSVERAVGLLEAEEAKMIFEQLESHAITRTEAVNRLVTLILG
ncbi:MAG TPA: methylmalonyl Co-A mutase-associated GTPase MeaB [Candidatus Binatia bacterium]|nr:methylmalonyl Co-A mutase-associated GTPase MeaB [Candidatus Binatia bacterium]